jgi:hypothetical protein
MSNTETTEEPSHEGWTSVVELATKTMIHRGRADNPNHCAAFSPDMLSGMVTCVLWRDG